ncbi:MAG: helix-turn-helix domain-containing protein [Candidatus Margulisbacteria bacterium]|nr:helix-turn-helix domain-containing protein [Candidatus Margulisiibacteriota bacterium]
MNKKNWLKGIKESETIELKPSLSQMNEIIETMTAFANTKGGKIVIGISDSGRILGVEIGKDTIERLTNKIRQEVDPKIHPHISIVKADKKNVLVVEVKPSHDKLVLASGRPYKRVGKSTVRVSKDEYEGAILEKHRDKLRFDKQICKGAVLKDIDDKKVKSFLRRAKIERKLEIDPGTSIKEALKKLNLIVDGKISNAALLLFGKNPQEFISQAEVKCARFKGIKPLEFIDMKVFWGSVIDQREDALEFVKEHIRLHAEIKGTERVEKWEYPIEAIREAITNAVCHRDYMIQSSIQIRIFDDRLEVWGCGPLPAPLTPEDLGKKHRSILRNPLIGRCFFLIKYIEEWGTGTNRMIETCLSEGLPEPIFEEASGSLVVTFRKYYIPEDIGKLGLNERQKTAVEFIKQHGMIALGDFKKIWRKTADRTLRKDLADLTKMELIEPVGEKRGRKYVFK